ncbi:hypothetical protein EDB85DRAFT_1919193 [Lactarius pseudohatsudake]|nr:hypothetical protein EDB85DRAFT_1919193 [Lactarius pseudohatsudake]
MMRNATSYSYDGHSPLPPFSAISDVRFTYIRILSLVNLSNLVRTNETDQVRARKFTTNPLSGQPPTNEFPQPGIRTSSIALKNANVFPTERLVSLKRTLTLNKNVFVLQVIAHAYIANHLRPPLQVWQYLACRNYNVLRLLRGPGQANRTRWSTVVRALAFQKLSPSDSPPVQSEKGAPFHIW